MADMLFELGRAQEKNGELDHALATYKQVLALDAGDQTSRQTMFALVIIRFAFGWHIDMVLRCALATLCTAGCVATVYGTCSVGPAVVCALVPFWEPGNSQPLRLA